MAHVFGVFLVIYGTLVVLLKAIVGPHRSSSQASSDDRVEYLRVCKEACCWGHGEISSVCCFSCPLMGCTFGDMIFFAAGAFLDEVLWLPTLTPLICHVVQWREWPAACRSQTSNEAAAASTLHALFQHKLAPGRPGIRASCSPASPALQRDLQPQVSCVDEIQIWSMQLQLW
jgi:hypothetical protein